MDLAALRVRVKQLIFKPNTTASDDTGAPNNAYINAAINDARQAIYNDIMANLSYRADDVTSHTYAANAESVLLPTEVQNAIVDYVYVAYGESNTDQVMLKPIVAAEWVNYSEFGLPLAFSIMARKIYLRPKPTVAVSVHYVYRPNITDLTAEDDVPSELPDWAHGLIALRAVIQIRRMAGDPYDGAQQEYDERYDGLSKFFEKLVKDNHPHQTARSGEY